MFAADAGCARPRRPRAAWALAFALFAALGTGTSRTLAQERVDPETQKHFDIANGLYGEQRYADALVEYDAAYDRSHNFRILYNRGNCLVMLKREPEAIETFERYLHDGGDQLAEERRSKVRADIESLKLRLGSIVLAGAPDGAEVVLDGRTIGRTPLGAPIAAGAGTHDLTVRWSASIPGWSGEVRVIAGAPSVATIVLAPPPGTPTSVGELGTHPPPADGRSGEAPRPPRKPRAPGGLVAPAIAISVQIGGSLPENDANIGSTHLLSAGEVGLAWRATSFFEAGIFYGGALGSYTLNPVANLETNADFSYRTYGLRARMHLVRGAWFDGWFGVDLGRYSESWTLKGTGSNAGFSFEGASTVFALGFGLDVPVSRALAIGANTRYVASSASDGSAHGCTAGDCAGTVFTNGYSSNRGFFELGLRLIWSVPYGGNPEPPPASTGPAVAALPERRAF
jgi:tetratricopeptide (TPR) repeat protein